MAAEPRPRARARSSAVEPSTPPAIVGGGGVGWGLTPADRSGSDPSRVAGAEAFVDLAALARRLAARPWAPLRLTGGAADRLAQIASPRLPHALVLHVAQHQRAAAARWRLREEEAPSALAAPDVVTLAALAAVPVEAVERLVDGLLGAGALVPVAATASAAAGLRVDPGLLAPSARAAILDWERVAEATAGSPSAWVLAHQFAELLEPERWTPVSRAVLAEALGCGTSGVRAALERLDTTGVLERREQRGGVSVYRFRADLIGAGAGWGPARQAAVAPVVQSAAGSGRRAHSPEAPSAATPAPRAPSPVHAPGAEPASRPVAASGARVQVGGVSIDVPAGMRVVVSVGPDGRPTIAIESA